MTRRLRLLVLIGLGPLVAGCVPGDMTMNAPASNAPATPVTRSDALSGRRREVAFLLATNPDCTSLGALGFDFDLWPRYGTVFFTPDTRAVANFWPAEDPHFKCNGRRLDGTMVVYTSYTNFHGTDRFKVTMILPTGQSLDWAFVISVR